MPHLLPSDISPDMFSFVRYLSECAVLPAGGVLSECAVIPASDGAASLWDVTTYSKSSSSRLALNLPTVDSL